MNILIKVQVRTMEIGVAIAVFVISGLTLMSLFCVVTKCFDYRLKKALLEQNEVYSLIQGVEGEREDINEGEYEDFVQKRIEERRLRELEKDKNYRIMREMVDVDMLNTTNTPLKGKTDDIYEISKLKKRLGIDIETGSMARSLVSAKSFKPERLTSMRHFTSPADTKAELETLPRQNTIQQPQTAEFNFKQPHITEHKFVTKIVSYTKEGIEIIENKVMELKKQAQDGELEEKRNTKRTLFVEEEIGLEEAVQTYGFEIGKFSAFKFTTRVQIFNIRLNEPYTLASLRKKEQKEEISMQEYERLKQSLGFKSS